jgi:peptidoglycan hydrolase-like protein with peptidoglycan-binding domain
MSRTTRLVAAVLAAVVMAFGLVAATGGPAQALLPTCDSFTSSYASGQPNGTAPHYHNPSIGSGSANYYCSLVRGNTGWGVVVLQEALNSCYGQSLVVDGNFGGLTKEALKAAQRDINRRHGVGIAVDGEYGNQTRRYFRDATYDHANGGQIIWGQCGIAGAN